MPAIGQAQTAAFGERDRSPEALRSSRIVSGTALVATGTKRQILNTKALSTASLLGCRFTEMGPASSAQQPYDAEHWTEAVPPETHCLMANVDPAFGQQVLNVPK